MRISKSNLVSVSILAAAISTAWFAPASAASGFISDGARRANTYQTYAPGETGCLDDLGYGRVRSDCHGD